jgi:hypothetical protein
MSNGKKKTGADDYVAAGATATDLGRLPAQPVGTAAIELEVAELGDDLVFRVPALSTEVHMAAVHSGSDGLKAEATVSVESRMIHWGSLNLASTPGRVGLARKLTETCPEVPWAGVLERVCRHTALHRRQGAPLVAVEPAPMPPLRYLLAPLAEAEATTILYADGDSGKGWVACLMLIAVVTGERIAGLVPSGALDGAAAYLDYESEEAIFRGRLYALTQSLGLTLPPRVFYRRMTRPFSEDAAWLRSEFARQRVRYFTLDSLTVASGSEPEGTDASIRTMSALHSFTGTTRTVLAHLSKAAAEQARGSTRPFGSVFNRNLARSLWELRRSDEAEDLVISFAHRKHNNTPRPEPPFCLRFRALPDGTTAVTCTDLTQAPDLLARAPLPQQLRAALANGAKTIPALALELDAKEDSVDKAVRRLSKAGVTVQLPGDKPPYLWGLVAR